jgi:ATP-dependent DNA helicase DinG
VLKDIPLLTRALGRTVDVAVMKGRANYLCLLRLGTFERTGTLARRGEAARFRRVRAWAETTLTGDRSEIAELPDNAEFWRDISAASENCVGQSCSLFDACWVTRMRQQAQEADLIVVNHHLLCADLAVKDGSYGQVIPLYDTVILDEAHLIEDVATQYFGLHVSTYRLEDLCHDVERELKLAQVAGSELRRATAAIRQHGLLFFELIARQAGQRLGRDWMTAAVREQLAATLAHLDSLRAAVLALPEPPEPLGALAARAQTLHQELEFVGHAEDDDHVYFVETRGRGTFLCATPIDVSQRLVALLFDRLRAAVLTSATLAVDGRFDYLRSRLGLRDASAQILDSPFDYAQQAVLYVPHGMPEPQSARFVPAALREIARLLHLSAGRAFVLFTSYANLNAVAQQLVDEVPFPLFIQGEAPKTVLLEAFKSTPNAVLLGTSSFWQGVDVVGEQLSCVIIDKLPFASPSDPVVAARIDRLRQAGGNPFADYQIPEAVLALKQGLGRLIRSASDRGVLAVLDSRLVEKTYGARFLASIPPARLVHELEDVARFFS